MTAKRMFIWLIALIPMLMTLVLLPSMADTVPAHYGIDGMVDRYDSKYTMLIFPFIIIVVVAVRDLVPQRIGRDDDQRANMLVLDKLLLPVVVVLAALNALTLWLATGQVQNIYTTGVPVPQLILAAISLLFVFIGNLLPKTKPNWYIGIRVPWTVNDPLVWHKTHRWAGILMTAWGIIALCVTVLIPAPEYAVVVVLAGTIGVVASTLVYSYICYRQQLGASHE